MSYMLILVLYRGMTILTQEFSSKQTCETAIAELTEMVKVNNSTIYAKCIPK